ncbi:hypothetical protein AJ87_08640 [Rhizobium yanglingense]|nr:hypothetical protein AJ87_08640 [Rhizobium yanglingense]
MSLGNVSTEKIGICKIQAGRLCDQSQTEHGLFCDCIPSLSLQAQTSIIRAEEGHSGVRRNDSHTVGIGLNRCDLLPSDAELADLSLMRGSRGLRADMPVAAQQGLHDT